MNYDEIYKNAYLKQLNIIKEEAEDETEAPAETVEESDLTEECCGKECCGKDCKPAEECGEINEDAEDGEGDDETQDIEDTPVQKVCFLTSDQALIDALNSGVEEVVLFTNAKDETTGEDTVVEVKFGKDSFGGLEIIEAEEVEDTEDDETDEFEECCKAPIEEDEEEGGDEVDDDGGEDVAEECNQLNECEKLLNELKEKRNASKYGPY
jgi:hypothetical protein